ncbi:hypothetical protein ACUXAV_000795 [Cupriavidus metallidurans]|jgi:hypothetical protein|uniref:hypothetical protein n=1 Tax=Cupriavidus TaxID=106589 RepID=UPI000493096F|nr:hypothetical protein [Cupriavidus metallidurans]KWW37564.1 hypothetical protein AU374_01329 [Cupriavidus metallidurans]MDE4918696.1 hypothetical protein [Cupriavidus metallidurans]
MSTNDYETVWADCVRRLLDGDAPVHVVKAIRRLLTPEQLEASRRQRQHQARHLALAALLQAGDDMADLASELSRRVG